MPPMKLAFSQYPVYSLLIRKRYGGGMRLIRLVNKEFIVRGLP